MLLPRDGQLMCEVITWTCSRMWVDTLSHEADLVTQLYKSCVIRTETGPCSHTHLSIRLFIREWKEWHISKWYLELNQNRLTVTGHKLRSTLNKLKIGFVGGGSVRKMLNKITSTWSRFVRWGWPACDVILINPMNHTVVQYLYQLTPFPHLLTSSDSLCEVRWLGMALLGVYVNPFAALARRYLLAMPIIKSVLWILAQVETPPYGMRFPTKTSLLQANLG